MATLRSKIDNNTEIIIEVDERHSAYQKTGSATQKTAQLAEEAFGQAVETIAAVGRRFTAAQSQFGDNIPQDFEISFGVKITAGGDVWLAKVAGEAQITAKVVWRK